MFRKIGLVVLLVVITIVMVPFLLLAGLVEAGKEEKEVH